MTVTAAIAPSDIGESNAAWQDRLFMGRYMRVGAKVDF